MGLGFNLSQLVGTYLSYSFNVLIKVHFCSCFFRCRFHFFSLSFYIFHVFFHLYLPSFTRVSSFQVKTVNQLAFPAVTICNMCPIKKSKFLEYYFDVNNATHNTTSAHNRVKRSVQGLVLLIDFNWLINTCVSFAIPLNFHSFDLLSKTIIYRLLLQLLFQPKLLPSGSFFNYRFII